MPPFIPISTSAGTSPSCTKNTEKHATESFAKYIFIFNLLHNFKGVVAWKLLRLLRPFPSRFQAILMLWGMPRAVKRLRQRAPIAASAFWLSNVRAFRVGPMIVL